MVYDKELIMRVSHLVHRLPPMPEDIDRLLRLMSDVGRNEKELKTLIMKDPAICAEILHLANSDCYGAAASVETIEDAIRLVGLEPLIQLVGVSFADGVLQKEFTPLKNLNQYFEHSRQISLGCRILAEIGGWPKHEQKMYAVAGLLHDIGRLVILLSSNRTAATLMGTSTEELLSVIHNEQQALGMNHCDVGAQICGSWHFSPILHEGVLRHHTPQLSNGFSTPGAVIFLAHFVTASDFTGTILSRTPPLVELIGKLNLATKDFEAAGNRYSAMA